MGELTARARLAGKRHRQAQPLASSPRKGPGLGWRMAQTLPMSFSDLPAALGGGHPPPRTP